MTGRVSLARKNLFQDRRRALLAVSGVAASLVLVLVLDGVFAGAMRQVTAYMRNSPADVFVSQQDVRAMHMSVSAIPPGTVEAVQSVEGVAWAEGLRYTTSIVDTGDESRLSYVLGYDVTTGRGGPRRLAAGQPPRAGEVLVDDVVADELGVAIGDTVHVLGAPFRVSGLTRDGTNLVNTTVLVTTDDFARLRGDSIAYVLVGADDGVTPEQLATRLRATLPAVTVQTRAEFVRQEGRIVRDMAADIMQITTLVGFLIALAVIGLTLFTATIAKLREYGVVKALGASSARLALTVAAQAAWSVALGLVVAVGLALAVGTAVDALTPNVQVAIEADSVARTAAGALLVGALDIAVRAVRAVDLDVARGEIVLIMGPSGSGKTTLLLMLGAMMRPTSGSVNLAGTTGRAARDRATQLLHRVGLGNRLAFRPDQLSGGEKQRVAVARALANDPTVLLADEPTANLDSGHGREIARLLRRLAAEDGRSVVMVSHDDRLKEVANRILWLEDGAFRELAGMAVEQDSALQLQADGTRWWFCSDACRVDFAAHPGRYRSSQPTR